VHLSILETGLGGRLDSTTATNAEIAAITPIAFDHQEYLGNTIEEIASEKAAIIRHGITSVAVIAAQTHDEAHSVILKRCLECGVMPRDVDDCIVRVLDADATGRLRVSFATAQDVYKDVRLALRGRHQAANASVAIRLAEALRENNFPISAQNIRAGIERAFYAGRLEWREGSPTILFDGAHNAAGARALRGIWMNSSKRPSRSSSARCATKICAKFRQLFSGGATCDPHANRESARGES
jgi:dihydrofolate synthase/folylpolyglutamate synthase